jgi:YVTN family beta-propeller protein
MNKKAALVLSLVLIALLPLIHSNSNYALSAKSKKDLSASSSSFSLNKSKEIIDRKKPLENNTSLPINPIISGKVIVTKKIINQGGGTNKPSDFTISVSGNNPSPATFSGNADGTTITLEKGKYSITETGPSGYNSTSSPKCSGTINGGETLRCNLTNTFEKPSPPITISTLKVNKEVINEGGGTDKPSDFTINVRGNNPSPSSFQGNSDTGTMVKLQPGKYSVSESGPTSYFSNYSSDCSGTISSEQTKNCIITNKYNPFTPGLLSKIIVTKKVINQGGGTDKPSDFAISVSGNNPSPATFSGSADGVTVQLRAGKYSIIEEGPISSDYVPGKYTPNYSADCNGTIKASEIKNCIITNKYNPFIPGSLSKLIVTKKVINEGGGNKKASDFTISVSGNNPSPATFSGSADGVTVQLRAGKYSVTETGPLSDYTTDYSGECSGIASPGIINECTIINTYQPPPQPSAKLIVIKNVINKDSSSVNKKPSDFIITVHGNNPTPRSFPSKSGGGTTVTLYPGRYSVTEKGPLSGYTTDYSQGCEGNIGNSQAKACIITNEEITQPPSPAPIPSKPIIKTITGFNAPYGIITIPDNGFVYASNYGQFNTTGTVTVINSSTNFITDSVDVDKNPQAIAYDSANGFVYTANLLSNNISVINASNNAVVDTIPIGNSPGGSFEGMAINPTNNTIYVANSGSNTISVINGTTNTVVRDLLGFHTPSGIAYNTDNEALYVTNRGSNTVSVINGSTNNLLRIIPVGAAPTGTIYNAANGYIYVANSGSNTISVINGTTNTVVATVHVGTGPNAITYNSNNGEIYTANSISGTISVIDGLSNTVSQTISLATSPNAITYNSSDDSIYVTNMGSDTVSAISNISSSSK